jgi:hypothetical protein
VTVAKIEAGTLVANREERTVSGLLLKFGETGRTNLGRFSVPKGAFKLPKDVKSFLNLVDTHARPIKSVGTALFAQEADDGIYGTWRINDGPEGDALLAAWESGDQTVPRKLSIEVDDVQLRNGVAISGSVHGAALVKAGAFPSSSLMAEDTPDEEPAASEPTTTTEKFTEERTDEAGVTKKYTTTRTTTVDGDKTTITEKTVIEEPETPAEEEEPAVAPATATVPATLVAGHAPAAGPSAASVFDLITQAISSERNGQPLEQSLMAALADVKTTGGLGSGATGGNPIQPAWLGELWNGKSYVQKYIPLIRSGSITAQDEKGFIIEGTDDLVQPWNGNKTELPTGSGSARLRDSIFQRWGWAADIAREWFDIPANRPLIEAFLKRLANSYARQTDIWTGKQIVLSATAGGLIAPGVFPERYPNALGMLIQGIEAVGDSDDTPTFAIVNPLAWNELIYTEKDRVPEFVTFSFGTGGEGTADGKVKVVKGDTGIVGSPSVVVGSAAAAHVNQLPGASPLNLDALDLARGGVDRAVIGYTQYMNDYPAGLKHIGIADA